MRKYLNNQIKSMLIYFVVIQCVLLCGINLAFADTTGVLSCASTGSLPEPCLEKNDEDGTYKVKTGFTETYQKDGDGNDVVDADGNKVLDSTCSTSADGKTLTSDYFTERCEEIKNGEYSAKDVTEHFKQTCSDAKMSNAEEDTCKMAAATLEAALIPCAADSTNIDSYNEGVKAGLGVFCNNVCHLEAMSERRGKNMFEKGVDFLEEVGEFLGSVVDFFKGMLTCLFSGEVDVETRGPRENMSASIWFSPIVKALLAGINVIAYKTRDVLMKYALALLAVGLAMWLLFRIMRTVSSVRVVDLQSFLTDIGRGLMRAAIIAILIAAYAGGIFDLFLVPVAETFAAATDLIVKGAQDANKDLYCGTKITSGLSIDSFVNAEVIEARKEDMLPPISEDTDGDRNVVRAMAGPVVNAITNINTRLMLVYADGWSMVRYAIANASVICLVPDLPVLGYGILFMAFAGVLSLMIPLKYLDALIKLGMVICLMPFFLTAWTFPSTRKFTTKAFALFMHSLVLILMLSVIAVICLTAVDVAFGNVIGCEGVSAMKEAIDLNSEGNGFVAVLSIIMLLIGCVKLVSIAPQLASSFVNAPASTAVGDSLGKMMGKVGSLGVATAGNVARTAGGAALDKFKSSKGGKMITDAVKHGAETVGRAVGSFTVAPVAGVIGAAKSMRQEHKDIKSEKKMLKAISKGQEKAYNKVNSLGGTLADEDLERKLALANKVKNATSQNDDEKKNKTKQSEQEKSKTKVEEQNKGDKTKTDEIEKKTSEGASAYKSVQEKAFSGELTGNSEVTAKKGVKATLSENMKLAQMQYGLKGLKNKDGEYVFKEKDKSEKKKEKDETKPKNTNTFSPEGNASDKDEDKKDEDGTNTDNTNDDGSKE